MSQVYPRISFVLYFFLYFINFGIEKTNNGRFGVRIVRKSKVKKLQAVDENYLYDVMSSSAWTDDKADDGGKLGKPGRNRCGKGRAKRGFKRNKVAPAAEKDEAWSKTSGKTPRAANKDCPYQEIGYTRRMELAEEDGKMTLKTSCQKWDLTTGKQIKLDIHETRESSSSLGTDLSQFLNVLNAPTMDNFNVCNSDGSPCELFSNEDNVPRASDVCITNEVVVDLRESSTSEETRKRNEKKSILSNFLSRFNRGPNTTKVRKIRI